MNEKFQNKYRIKSTRLEHWDYGSNAAYFVTICTKNKVCNFGNIIDGEMQLSPTGTIANVLWFETIKHAENIELDCFVIMPNHIHGIIVINKNIEPSVETRHVLSNTLSSIVGSYKSAVTKHANRLGLAHGWQPRFHDHIIRNHESLEKIQSYIINNPINWKDDKLYQG